MKLKPPEEAERGRLLHGPLASHSTDGNNGMFYVVCQGVTLAVCLSDGAGWDHVSVSRSDRCPTWEEMCFVKTVFFREDETVLEYHPAKRNYVNDHPYCLHLWRPQQQDIPLPPSQLTGLV